MIPVGKELRIARVVPVREYVTLEQAGLLMKAAYQMGLKRGRAADVDETWEFENPAIVGGEG